MSAFHPNEDIRHLSGLFQSSRSVPCTDLRRVGTERIKELALEAVDEAAAEALRGPIRRSKALAVALAWLLHFGRPSSPPERWPFTNFWDALIIERDHDRQAAVTAAANAIFLAMSVPRAEPNPSLFEQPARPRWSKGSSAERNPAERP